MSLAAPCWESKNLHHPKPDWCTLWLSGDQMVSYACHAAILPWPWPVVWKMPWQIPERLKRWTCAGHLSLTSLVSLSLVLELASSPS
jgi:hypothetical protein